MNLYYNALYDDPRVAGNMVNAVQDNLTKFDRYLSLAIKALREKQRISSIWEKVQDPTYLSIEPLVYEVVVSSSAVIKVLMKEQYLELNVTNSTLFDTSDGIRLDDWTVLRPEQFEIYSITNKRHLLHIKDPALYKGEKNASTKDGGIAEISEFEIKDLVQNSEKISILHKEYDHTKECYVFTIEGHINEEHDLFLNGFFIDRNNWFVINTGQDKFTNEEGQVMPILGRHGNTLYIESSFPKPLKVFKGQQEVEFYIQQTRIPKNFQIGEDMLTIDVEKGHYSTLGKTSFLEDGYIHNHPDFNFPMFKIGVQKNLPSERRKEHLAIRLIEEDEDDDLFSKSKTDYFFDQDIEELEGIIDGKQTKILIDSRREDERILVIKGARGERLEYKDVPNVLSIRVNTYQLEVQRKSLQRLKNTPLLEHKSLIALCQKKSMSNIWPTFSVDEIHDWRVLTDLSREGIQAQRDFVRKALCTPDFVLLEGPPGSGKTTAILELILQLVKNKKRILLCGSTHVAIDNVLERLKEKNLMEGIFPLRIGGKESVSEKIQEFCLDEYENHKYGEIIIEAANLVCGTTIGILRHPLFQLKGDEPPIPLYDYLIIDESSKTTFQEFLIPALYAKKWILVGDIKQLPPYNDREQIIAGIDDNEKIKPSLKKAALLIYQYLHNYKVRMPVCIIESEDVIKEIQKELAATEPEDIRKGVAVVNELPSEVSGSFVNISLEDIKKRTPILWALNGIDVLFVSEKLFEDVHTYIPSHMVVIREGWENSAQHYQVNAYYFKHPKDLHKALEYTWKHERNRDKQPVDFIIEQKTFLKKGSWASEYGWRLVRVFELENVENSRSKGYYKEQLSLLSPKTASDRALKDIEHIGDITLPSILQSLQEGVGKNRDQSTDTTLNSGFSIQEKLNRFVTLNYQHRMHPEISRFPRAQFYRDTALLDATYTKIHRQWSYSRYPSRNIWLDVNGRMRKSSNEAEVKFLIKELKHFIDWAEINENQENENGRWEVACLSFYNAQRKLIAEKLRELTGEKGRLANFSKGKVDIKNYTVDKFQGQEADITFVSMVRTEKGMGFMDNPNRLNVGITRARFQRVILGKYDYFLNNKQSDQLKLLARDSVYFNNV